MPQNDPSGMPPLAEGFYRRLLADAAVAMVATDAEFNIVCWNAAAGNLLNVKPPDMLGRSIYQLVPEDRHKLLGKVLDRTLKRRQTSRFEIHPRGPQGQASDLVLILSPVGDGRGGVAGIAAWILDETRRTRLAEQLAQAEKMASLGTLAGGVAHHFNNILGGVATFVDYALTSGDEAAMKRALQMTAEAAARAAKITQSLLSFAKADSARGDLADLTEVVLTFCNLVERPLADKHIALELDLQPVPVVPVQAARMHQVLRNLLANAEEAIGDGGTISIHLRRDEDEVLLTFADDGCGIDPKDLPQIFEPFYTTKGLLAGGDRANPGLGLSIVHGFVSEMSGHIEVQSEPGRGTKFLIHFPMQQ